MYYVRSHSPSLIVEVNCASESSCVVCRFPHKLWAPPRFARENASGKDVPQSMLEESVKGIVNRRPKVAPSQCSEFGFTLSQRVEKCVRDCQFLSHMAIIWLLIRPGSLFCFYGSLSLYDSSFPPQRPAFNPHTITSPKSVVSNPFLSVMGKPGDAH